MTEPSASTSVPPERPVPAVLDAASGLTALALHVVATAGRAAHSASVPLVKVARQGTRLLPGPWPPARIRSLVRHGAVRREMVDHEVAEALDRLVPLVAVAVLRRLDLAQLVEDHVDVRRIVQQVDLDEVAQRLDVDAVAGRLDLDAVVARVDLDGVARRLDLNGLMEKVDLDAVAARLDVDAVIDRVDLIELARTVVAGIDLPEIIRDSTGAVASDTMREVRMQGISGDDAVARVVDRLLLRHHRRDGGRPDSGTLPLVDEGPATPAASGNGARPT
jgi:hypothetical protein